MRRRKRKSVKFLKFRERKKCRLVGGGERVNDRERWSRVSFGKFKRFKFFDIFLWLWDIYIDNDVWCCWNVEMERVLLVSM